MAESELKIKKKYRPGSVEADPKEALTIVINYAVEEYTPNSGD